MIDAIDYGKDDKHDCGEFANKLVDKVVILLFLKAVGRDFIVRGDQV